MRRRSVNDCLMNSCWFSSFVSPKVPKCFATSSAWAANHAGVIPRFDSIGDLITGAVRARTRARTSVGLTVSWESVVGVSFLLRSIWRSTSTVAGGFSVSRFKRRRGSRGGGSEMTLNELYSGEIVAEFHSRLNTPPSLTIVIPGVSSINSTCDAAGCAFPLFNAASTKASTAMKCANLQQYRVMKFFAKRYSSAPQNTP